MSTTLFAPFNKEKCLAYVHLTRFDRPVGIELVLWSTLWAVFLAALDFNQLPPWHVVVIFSLGATLMRGAGCAINDFADRKVDGQVWRTKNRPLADGRLRAKEAVWAFLVLSWISAALLIFLPIDVFYWSFGAVALAFVYPFMKRITHLPQFVLAMAFGWAIPMAYVAVSAELFTGSTNVWCWLLFAGYMAWTVAYDTQYAMADRHDDVKIGIKSTAILFGKYDVFIISLLQGFFLLCLAGVFWHYFGAMALLTLLPVIAMFVYQNKKCLTYQPVRCFEAFLHNVWVGRYVFVIIVILALLKTQCC
ncbi:4-hydroxybenzoate polyprenyltransferase [Moraxella macacae 0408225]|uniref:4-hydroxybenzoate octaprenyltransferase n=1 Tax=Moraxella macacae 0408225 TaxID=1230338 RepID=L2F9C5_9GAMM|nr:4-hydroxybenzoate octaprenyltransferase [Moraxella macacae]ELA09664.1 4-hydroxybenzoate polyprenyltransferase [Moraxella macacae 0408225]